MDIARDKFEYQESKDIDYAFEYEHQKYRFPFYSFYGLNYEVGRGGFGVVYDGFSKIGGTTVAVKYIWKEKIKRWGQVRLSPNNLL